VGFPIENASENKHDSAREAAQASGRAGGNENRDANREFCGAFDPNSAPASHGTVQTPEDRAGVVPVPLGIGRWSRWIAVAGGFGYVPGAPGTAGSAAGALLFLAAVAFFRGTGAGAGTSSLGLTLSPLAFLALYGLVVLGLLLLGIRAAGRAEVDFGRRDDGRIVIDEVVGQLIALAPLALLFRPEDGRDGFLGFSIAVVTGFVLFRLFDVWKPGAIGWAERRFKGGIGVMADDVVAGVHGAVCLTALHWLVSATFPSLLAAPAALALGSTAGSNAVALLRSGFGAMA